MSGWVTVGHSNQGIDAFIATLKGAAVDSVVDVRKLPGSRAHPHFNEDSLQASLSATGISYHRLEALAGRQPKSRTVEPHVNGAWRNQSFHNYADYALGSEFSEGLDELLEMPGRVAVMCSEAVWWRCHRRIIADHLLARGVKVEHLFPGGKLVTATLTPGGVMRNGTVTYPTDPELHR